MAQLKSLYYQTEIRGTVSLSPNQLNANIKDEILKNLRERFESKTTEYGLVIGINAISNHSFGVIGKYNFMAITDFQVKYACLLCSPIKNLEMICQVNNIIKGYLICSNGPITAAVPFSNIDTTIFEISGDNVKHSVKNKFISVGDFIKVSIADTKTTNTNISVVCKLLNVASSADIKKYESEQKLIENFYQSDNDDKTFI